MALYNNSDYIAPPAKKTRQGKSKNTKLAATSRNSAKKRYRGHGEEDKGRYAWGKTRVSFF